MKGWDPEGQLGPKKPLPDTITILETPVDKIVGEPSSEQRAPMAQEVPPQHGADQQQTEQAVEASL